MRHRVRSCPHLTPRACAAHLAVVAQGARLPQQRKPTHLPWDWVAGFPDGLFARGNLLRVPVLEQISGRRVTSGELCRAIRAGELVSLFCSQGTAKSQGGLGLAPGSALALRGRIVREVRLVVRRVFLFFLADAMAFLGSRRKTGESLWIEKSLIKCNPSYLSITPTREGPFLFRPRSDGRMGQLSSSPSLIFSRSAVHWTPQKSLL